jgi:alpha-N-acetylglucosaminidase
LAEVLMACAWTIPISGKPAFLWIFAQAFAGDITGKPGSLAFGLAMIALCWAAGWWLDRRRIYIRL